MGLAHHPSDLCVGENLPINRVIAELVFIWQENKSMPMAEQIQDEINAPPRYDSKLQTRPALEAVNTEAIAGLSGMLKNDRGDLPDERNRNYGTTFLC